MRAQGANWAVQLPALICREPSTTKAVPLRTVEEEQRGDRPRLLVQFGVSQARRFNLAVGEESEGRGVGLLLCPPAEDLRERG